MKKMTLALILCFILLIPTASFSAIQTKMIEYNDDNTVLEGYVAYDDAVVEPRPGVLVVHDWMGFGPFANKKAEDLAKLGYIALAVDIYGKGVRPQNIEEAGTQAALYKGDRRLLRKRILAGYGALKGLENVDVNKIAAIGFCFGGTTALELARSGAPIAGVVSFHGGLNTPSPMDTKDIKAKVLVLHGADDPFVPPEEVKAFEKEMNDAKVDWQMIYYSGAVHSFTNPLAGSDPAKGAAYQRNADQRSWAAMKLFFDEIF